MRIDHAARVVHVSELLRFYHGDFGPDDSALLRFVARYSPEPIPPGSEIRFLPFDWTVANSARSS